MYRNLGGTMAYRSVNGLELTASLATYMFSFWLLAGLSSILRRWRESIGWWKNGKPKLVGEIMPIGGSVAGQSSPRCLSFAVIGLSVPLLWIIFTLRKVQEEMPENMGHEYGGNVGLWANCFLALFIPVAVKMAYRWRFGPVDGNSDWTSSARYRQVFSGNRSFNYWNVISLWEYSPRALASSSLTTILLHGFAMLHS